MSPVYAAQLAEIELEAILPEADTFIQSNASTIQGEGPFIIARGPGNPLKIGLLRFSLDAIPAGSEIVAAELSFSATYTGSAPNAGSVYFQSAVPSAEGHWDENVIWGDAVVPNAGNAVVAASLPAKDQMVTIDVKSLFEENVHDSSMDFYITTDATLNGNAKDVNVYSKEMWQTYPEKPDLRPRLRLIITSPVYSVSGKVTSEQGLALANAQLSLYRSTAPETLVDATTTDSRGDFWLPSQHPGGTYIVKAVKDGFLTQTLEITIDNGDVDSANFVLTEGLVPRVIESSPIRDEREVDVFLDRIELQFNDEMEQDSLNPNTILLRKLGASGVTESILYTSFEKTSSSYTFLLDQNLEHGITYGITVTTSVASALGIHPDAEDTIHFSTASIGYDTLPPEIDVHNELARMGYLDVTLYGADPNGQLDATASIRQTIERAFQYNMAVYFPSGTYLVSDTLHLKQDLATFDNKKRQGHVLIGDTRGTRPLIKLADNAVGFQDDSKPQGNAVQPASINPVLHFWHENVAWPGNAEGQKANENYNQVIRGIDFDLGQGNAGAVAIRHRGAEGSAITDVQISAYGAFAGVYELLGSGGSITNLAVDGGKYGIYAPWGQPIPLITGLTLKDQTELAIYYTKWTPLTIVGFHIQKQEGPVFSLNKDVSDALGSAESAGNLSLVDGIIELTGEGVADTVLQNTDRSIYMKNVYIKNAERLAVHTEQDQFNAIEHPASWTIIKEFAYSKAYSSPSKLINGTYTSDTVYQHELASADPPTDLVSRHIVPEHYFRHMDEDVINVKLAPYYAKGDGVTDDTAAIQAAIDAGSKVFLPRGVYLVSDTLRLRSDTMLFGVARHITLIDPGTWSEPQETPILTTPNDASATTSMSNFKILLRNSSHQIQAIKWMAGQNSIVRDVWVYTHPLESVELPDSPHAIRRTIITGQGGGRWYNTLGMIAADSKNDASRQLLIEGTSQPLTFYMLHNQYHQAPRMAEIVNASNVTIYSLKSETILNPSNWTGGPWPISIGIDNSSDISIIGYAGLAQMEPGRAVVEVNNSSNVLMANFATWGEHHYSTDSWYYLKETIDGQTRFIKASGLLNLYRRDELPGGNGQTPSYPGIAGSGNTGPETNEAKGEVRLGNSSLSIQVDQRPDGSTAKRVGLKREAFQAAIDALEALQTERRALVIEWGKLTEEVQIELPTALIADREQRLADVLLVFQGEAVSYSMPIGALAIDQTAERLNVQPEELVIVLLIQELPEESERAWKEAAGTQGATIIASPLSYRLIAKAGNGAELELRDFENLYVERTLRLIEVEDLSKLTGVRLEEGAMELRFVPTVFQTDDEGVTAVLRSTGNSSYGVVASNKSFNDLAGHWAQTDIEAMASKLLLKGVNTSEYAPNRNITRAEFTVLLARALGLNESAEAGFVDVRQDSWYAGSIGAAVRAGLVEGTGPARFEPESYITREEMAVLLYRSSMKFGKEPLVSTTVLTEVFSDWEAVRPWATEAVRFCLNQGLLLGGSNQRLHPQEYATRAQAATLLKRLLQHMQLIN